MLDTTFALSSIDLNFANYRDILILGHLYSFYGLSMSLLKSRGVPAVYSLDEL